MRIDPAATIDDTLASAKNPPVTAARDASPPTEVLRTFDPASQRHWCELVRDVVALANSGGGTLLVQIVAHRWSGDLAGPLAPPLTAEALIHRIREFTASSFANVIVQAADQAAMPTTRLAVGPALLPIGFAKRGTYLKPGDPAEEIEVFAAGSFYFRHGEHSEPGTEADLRVFIEQLLRRVRRQWLHEIRKLVDTPTEKVLQSGTRQAELQPVRIVDDPNAPALQPQDVDRLYPYRLREVVAELNRRAGRPALTTYDVQATRRQHQLDERPDFVFHLVGAGRRYSPAMIDWLWRRWQHAPDFFRDVRTADQQMLRRRRQKPR